MLNKVLISLFERDLKRVVTEIGLYSNEESIWKTDKNISNSAGNLTLHLIGNLNAFIGKEIGKTDYIRNRDLEFSEKFVPRSELVKKLNDTLGVVNNALMKLDINDLEKEYPLVVFAEKTSTAYFLVHLSTHLNYHLGQINYHRRLIGE